MSNKKLGVGLIGAGFIGRFHIRSWEAVRDGDINGICDKNLEANTLIEVVNPQDTAPLIMASKILPIIQPIILEIILPHTK